MNLQEFDVRLRSLLVSRFRPPAGILATYAFTRRDSDSPFFFVTARWQFFDDPRETRSLQDYGDLILGEAWFDGSVAVDSLICFLANFGFAVTFEHVSEFWRTGERENFSNWPERQFEARMRAPNCATIPYGPVVRHGLRPFKSEAAAISTWVWPTRQWSGGEPTGLSEVRVALPDTRARFLSIDWTPSGLKVALELNVPVEEVQVQCIPRGGEDDQVAFIESDSTDPWVPPPNTREVVLYLVHADRTLLDQTQVAPGLAFLSATESITSVAQAEVDLRSGETDRIEFKPFIVPADGKETELIETIVAFANSEGGRLYVGVTDSGRTEGVPALRRAAGDSPNKALQALRERLQKITQERIKPVPAIEIEALEVFGDPVLMCRVSAVTDTPYSTQENDVFVRKGSTNRKADPRTELPALLRSEDGVMQAYLATTRRDDY